VTPKKVLIVGGGIAGLSLGTALRRIGVEAEIVERAPAFGAVGAGIVLGVNAMAVLRRLNLDRAAMERGYELGEGAITDAGGRTLMRTDFHALKPRFGPTLAIHRADLHELLLEGCAGLLLRSGTTVDALTQRRDAVEVTLSDRTEGVYDLVVGADGVRSRVRSLLFGSSTPVYAGYTCWRMVVPRPEGVNTPHLREMWGRGARFGVVPLTRDRVYCFAVANAPADAPDPEEGRVERFQRRFAGFGGDVPSVCAQITEPGQLIHGDLTDVEQEPWYQGRVVLTGDAAHAVTPNMGQGAAMALESSMVLAELIGEGGPLSETLAAWSARRRDRVRFVREQSRRIGRVAQWQSRPACALRNLVIGLTPERAAVSAAVRMASACI